MTRHSAILALLASEDEKHEELVERLARIESRLERLLKISDRAPPPPRLLTRERTARRPRHA